MSGDKKPPIIKKIIKKGHGGHHGGSWKVAYADFVTALMAFFLVMWLLAISSEAGRQALADYFTELTMSEAVFNGGMPSAFDATNPKPSILDGGCFRPAAGDSTLDVDGESDSQAALMAALLKTTTEFLKDLDSLPEGVDGGEGSGDQGLSDNYDGYDGPGGYESVPQALSGEDRQFAAGLEKAVEGSLGDAAAGQVLVERIKGGLRIQIVDKDGRPMFSSGGPALTAEARALFSVVAERLMGIPNKISIEGHTDAQPFAGQKMTNWELSTARASAARMYLASSGLTDDRVTAVTGYGSTQLLDKAKPNDPINRRISIMIWDEEPEPKAAPQTLRPAPNGPAKGERSAPQTPAPAGNGQNSSRPGLNGNGRSSQPPLRRAVGPRPRPAPPSAPALTREELEQQLIDSVMEKATSPDLSPLPPVPREEPRE